MLNYYSKISKYDVDRANINMHMAKKEKQNRRVVNAKTKRLTIDQEREHEHFGQVVDKINKIKEISELKQAQNDFRR